VQRPVQREPVASVASATLPAMREAAGLMTLPLDWQPNNSGAELNLKRHGEIAAAGGSVVVGGRGADDFPIVAVEHSLLQRDRRRGRTVGDASAGLEWWAG